MGRVVGLLLCAAWYCTIISGFYILYCPCLYLMFVNQKLYRTIADILFALWELYPVALFQCCYNTQLHHFGDLVNPDESTIIVLNHRTRVDWNFVWIALYHATQNSEEEKCTCKHKIENEPKGSLFERFPSGKSKIKFVLKDDLKNIPGLGWIMQLNYFLYVKRDWREDQINLSQFVDYYKRLRGEYRVVLFPEGTDLSEGNKLNGIKFAESRNLQQYEYVLHPRTTGFVALCSRLRDLNLASLYDVTIAYDRPTQTEGDLLAGHVPKHVYVHIKRYHIDQLPYEEQELRIWLNERWQEKETSLRKFHLDGTFIDPMSNRSPLESRPKPLRAAKTAFIFWTLVDLVFTYYLCTSTVFQFWVTYHSLLFVFVTWCFGGFQNIQYKLLGCKI